MEKIQQILHYWYSFVYQFFDIDSLEDRSYETIYKLIYNYMLMASNIITDVMSKS